MKKILVNADGFKQLVAENYLYIDKTKFIEEILRTFGGSKLYLRPRRFGKTTNMLMLKEYFDITKKEENKDLFKGLYIDSFEEYKKHQNAYPLIFISLKETKQDTWEDMYESVKDLIRKIYNEDDYVKTILKDNEIRIYERILNKEADKIEYQNSLQQMTEYLYRYHNEKTVVLIDEYDALLNQAYTKGFIEQAMCFIRSFLSASLKNNLYLKCGVLTGVLQIGQHSIFSDLNNLEVCSALTNYASEYFGFTKEEVIQMLREYNMEEKAEEVIKWYDGYNFNGLEIFNPWSILNYLKNNGKLIAYWVNTGNTNLADISAEGVNTEIVEAVGKLLNNETIEIETKTKTVYGKLEGNLQSFLNTLLFTGYLTIDSEYMNEDSKIMARVKIPNEEIKTVIKDMQYKWFPKFKDSDLVLGLCKAIVEQDDEEFIINLNSLVEEETSYFNSSEDFYNGLFTSAMLRMPKEYIREREYETGYGRIDYMIYRQDKSVGYIFEFKTCKTEEELEDKATEGMQQIYDKKYYTMLQKKDVKEIYLYSIAFAKKRARVKKEKLKI